jgi:hypothetical protein
MAITRTDLRAAAKGVAQDASVNGGTGLKLLLTDPGDYNLAISQALPILSKDRPNLRVRDYTVTVAGFRFVLAGAGAILPSAFPAPTSPVAALVAPPAAGAVPNGSHTYRVTFVTAQGETTPGGESNAVVVADLTVNGQVRLTGIPVGPAGTTARRIYRAPLTGGAVKLVGTVADNVTTTLTDTLADAGLGADAPVTNTAADADAWVPGGSQLSAIWWPYLATNQGDEPLDDNTWRVNPGPGGSTDLELLTESAAVNDVIRLAYTAPHRLHDTDETKSSVNLGDWEALVILTSSLVLQVAANKLAQNTGNTSLPSDVVDRRTQSDVYRSLAKDLRIMYSSLVGHGPSDQLGPASGIKDLDVLPSHQRGFLWHPLNTH